MVALLCHHRHHCTIKQPSLAQRQRTGNRPFLIATILLNNANRKSLCRSKFFRNIAFVWLHYCVITATIVQSNNLPLHKDKGRKPSFFIATILPNAQTKPFAEASFPCTLICFATQLPALPRTKKTAQHKFTVRFLFDLLQLKS